MLYLTYKLFYRLKYEALVIYFKIYLNYNKVNNNVIIVNLIISIKNIGGQKL